MLTFVHKHKRFLLWVVFIALYMSILALISFLRSPTLYVPKSIKEFSLSYNDFYSVPQDNTQVGESMLTFLGETRSARVFFASLPLNDVGFLRVEFSVNCQQQYQGNRIHVDLFAEGYDSEEQEFMVVLSAGENKISGVIDKGKDAPAFAQLRIFTLDPGEFSVTDLQIVPVVPSRRTHYALIAIILCAATAGGVILADKKAIAKKRSSGSI